MARPRTARLATAYDLGHEHGRTGSRPAAADDVIGSDPSMQQAYDDGLSDGTDSLDAPTPTTSRPRAHRAKPTAARSAGAGPKSDTRPRPRPAASSTPAKGQRFSNPIHWGSGARGHVIGRPTLTPPRRVSVSDGTGFLFGLVLYSLAINWIRYGPAGMTSWLSAKFINKPTLTAAQAGVLATPPASPPRQGHGG